MTSTAHDGLCMPRSATMEEAVTDGNDYNHHHQLVLVDVVNPISHSLSSSSSITPVSPNSSSFSPNDGSSGQKVSGSDGVRSSTATPTTMIGTSNFTLPKDWTVEKIYRKLGGTSDKYYRDPQTGRLFRSLKGVERYITEGVTPTRFGLNKPNNHNNQKSLCSQHMIVPDEKIVDIIEEKVDDYELDTDTVSPPPTSVSTAFQLPDGWVVKEVPRISTGYADKYYFEPETGRMFRSLVTVRKHLAELEDDNSPLSVALEEIRDKNLPISKAFKLSTTIKNHGSYSSWKKSVISRKEKIPPRKINWVIGGGGDTWNAFMNDTLVQDSLKKQWGERFMAAITDHKDKQITTPLSG